MRCRFILILFAACLIMMCQNVYAGQTDDTQPLLDEYSDLYGGIFDEKLDASGVFDGIVPEFSAKDILKQLNSGDISLAPSEVLRYILRLLLGEVYDGAKLMALVLAMSVLSSYLSGLKSGFGGATVADCAFYACFTVISGIASAAFYEAALCASQAIENVAVFMRFIVPVLVTTLLTSGAAISAQTLEPTLLAIVEVAVWVIETVFIPGVMISTALNIVNGMSDKFKTDRMVKLLNSAVKWGLSVMLTVFVSLAGLKSIASAGADGLAVKLSKFAASNLIPMIGGILAESVETVLNCSVVIKNSVGILGIICLILIALRPVLKLGALLIIFRITAAVAEPVSEPKLITCISRLGDSISVLFSMIAAVTVMFVIVMTIMINAGSSAAVLGR